MLPLELQRQNAFLMRYAACASLAAAFSLAMAITFGSLYFSARRHEKPPVMHTTSNAGIVAAIRAQIPLPPETPTIATVRNPAKLADQPFFTNAEPGDKIVMYQEANEAVLYRPSTNAVLSVSELKIPD